MMLVDFGIGLRQNLISLCAMANKKKPTSLARILDHLICGLETYRFARGGTLWEPFSQTPPPAFALPNICDSKLSPCRTGHFALYICWEISFKRCSSSTFGAQNHSCNNSFVTRATFPDPTHPPTPIGSTWQLVPRASCGKVRSKRLRVPDPHLPTPWDISQVMA